MDRSIHIGALPIRIGFWGILYYSYDKDPTKPWPATRICPEAPLEPRSESQNWVLGGSNYPEPYSNYEGPYIKHLAITLGRPSKMLAPSVMTSSDE